MISSSGYSLRLSFVDMRWCRVVSMSRLNSLGLSNGSSEGLGLGLWV